MFICQNCGKEFTPNYYNKVKPLPKYCSIKCANEGKKKSIVRICKSCGKEFTIIPSREKVGGGVYCSLKCAGKEKKPYFILRCATCGKEFVPKKPHEKRKDHQPKFCSIKCANEGKKKSIVRICEACGKKFTILPCELRKSKGLYCSWECQRKSKRNRITKICLHCGKEFEVIKARENIAQFCNYNCKSAWEAEQRKGENNPRWNNGSSFEPYCSLFNNDFKRRVRAYFNNICVLCGATKQENTNRELCVHHVEENKQTCCDSSDHLFVVLCMKCHNKTHNKSDINYEQIFVDLINSKYEGKCYFTKEEFAQLENIEKV